MVPARHAQKDRNVFVDRTVFVDRNVFVGGHENGSVIAVIRAIGRERSRRVNVAVWAAG